MNTSASFLDRQPTMGDLIAWVLAVPTLIVGVTLCPYMLQVIPKFRGMFMMLKGQLPWVTNFVLSQGWWFFTIFPLVVLIGLLLVLVKSQSGVLKIIVAYLASQAIFFILGIGVSGIYLPILELQKNLM